MPTRLRDARLSGGFTLLELVIVIVAIALLASAVGPRLVKHGPEVWEARLSRNLQMLRQAIERFHQDCRRFPRDLGELDDTRAPADLPPGATWSGPYLESIPPDINGEEWNTGGWDYNPETGEVASVSPDVVPHGQTTDRHF